MRRRDRAGNGLRTLSQTVNVVRFGLSNDVISTGRGFLDLINCDLTRLGNGRRQLFYGPTLTGDDRCRSF